MRNQLRVISVLSFAACSADAGLDGIDGMAGPPPGPPPAASANWCARIHGGPAGHRGLAVDLSAAHAGVRFFGAELNLTVPDRALVAALTPPGALTDGSAARVYAGGLLTACYVDADDRPIPAARVELLGKVAVIHPGSGPVVLPPGTEAVAVDLRDVSAAMPWSALAAAVAPALAKPVPRSMRAVRHRYGMIDEVFRVSLYTNELALVPQEPLAATGPAELPLAVVTAPKMAPAAAELAVTLRLADRAWVVGEDLLSGVAEARWSGVGSGGVAWRAADLNSVELSQRWPDAITADRRLVDPTAFYRELPGLGTVPESKTEGDARPRIVVQPGPNLRYPTQLSLGTARAALMTVHGALRLFFPYFPVVGDQIDPRLDETLKSAESGALVRTTTRDLLRRLGEALYDGHNFVYDYGTGSAGSFAAIFEDVAGEPVVRRSIITGINPGDTIVTIGGVPTATWYATELPRTSGATDGYRFNLASRYWQQMRGPAEFEVRDPAGTRRTLTVVPASTDEIKRLGFAPTLRKAGPLTDLGAPNLYYLNLDADALSDINLFRTQLKDASASAGLVLDMRGYPGVNIYEMAARLVGKTFSSPRFTVPVYDGPDAAAPDVSMFDVMPQTGPSFAGPIALVVGHGSVSAAENFSTMLVDAKRVTVIGRTSAGTNGNITGLQLPGGFSFSFTGMLVQHADGSRFHGVGIVPSVAVAITALDLAAGRDAELLAAIAALPH